ncbi:GH92 family glycosyl hydrolase [Dysgonomonas sp. ZJ279]|uniref:GH92 family glycosyl hydrolase n=1 Tax=Dysgonomonas sp. ZJ279 TaxID=2709796 RepID=UPI0013EBCA7D|nr:GH92 family glycosyl hydrolase [Dysgonomonas sp. ZJ279]
MNNILKNTSKLLLVLLIGSSQLQAVEKDFANYVNTLQGTNSKFELTRGNTYPTTAMPWGMNFWTPQTGVNRDGWIYQHFKDSIRGFRQTHQCSSWTNDYAAFSLMPVSGKLVVDQFSRALRFSHDNEVAKPHYYKVTFDNQITTEMSPTERGVYFRFAFPQGKDSYVVVDGNSGGSMVRIYPDEQKIVGYCKNANHSAPRNFANYFVIKFNQPFTSCGTWDGKSGSISKNSKDYFGEYAGAYIQFKEGATVEAKVVSSFISLEQAELNFQKELAGLESLEEAKQLAQSAWNKQLGKVEVEGGTEEEKATFYSCFFRSMLFPRQFFEYDTNDKPIYYSPYDGKLHNGYMYTDNGFWDTFRAQFPLNILLHPEMHERYVQSLLDAYDQSGWLPSWSFPGHSCGMVGNHAASLIADAYAKGMRNFDTTKALEAMYHEATNKGPHGPSNGRDGWKEYFTMGYIPSPDYHEAVAKTLEFCYDDFCAMQVAKISGNDFYETIFKRQIYNYKNVYNPATRFMQGRQKDGKWVGNFDPTEWGGPYTEGSAWHYHWSVFHDVQGLINLMNGDKNFVAKLDSVFSVPNTFKVGTYGRVIHEMAEMEMINMGQYAHGNQPIQHMIYLYNYAGEPWKTQYWAREVMSKLYASGPNGYPGDEDQGQTSSWYAISAMGLYSVCPGTDQYVIGSPIFPKMTIHLENGKTLVIDAQGNTLDNRYIQSASLNGKPFTRTWLTYEELTNGGTIQYKMENKPNKSWGVLPKDRPYSASVDLK